MIGFWFEVVGAILLAFLIGIVLLGLSLARVAHDLPEPDVWDDERKDVA